MGLYEKIRKIHPKMTQEDFKPISLGGKIELFDDGKGNQSITIWDNKDFKKPTQSELDAVKE